MPTTPDSQASNPVSPLALPAPTTPAERRILTPEAVAFVAQLVDQHVSRHAELLEARKARQAALDHGERLRFLPETSAIRRGDWKVAPVRPDLEKRQVEITGPVDRKMVINALNSGADVFMADFEDANSPTWHNAVDGQANLMDAIRGTIDYQDPKTGKQYALKERVATLMVRPRGLHLVELHATRDGRPVPGSLFDFGLFFFHNAKALIERGGGPYFYLPKLESHLEARWWNDVFVTAQNALGIPVGSIKATVLIETLSGAFEMDEILYELKDHSAGLNCGRWDYIFSYIKKHRAHASKVLPDRSQVTMEQPFMRAYTQLLVKTCHRRGAHAMGGMAAQIPIKSDPEANEAALAKVRADKLREVKDGHDGTWVAHPGLVPIAREIFDAHVSGANQLGVMRDDVKADEDALLETPTGTRSEEGLRHNIRVGVQYLEAWLRGQGCVPLYNLMEDAATAEISRSQAWQWLKHGASLTWKDGSEAPLTKARFLELLESEMQALRASVGDEAWGARRFGEARELFEKLVTSDELEEFLTLPAYQTLTRLEG